MNGDTPVDVITGARLHFGLLCGTHETGWIFGGIGMMVRRPGWHLRIRQTQSGCEILCDSACVQQRIHEIVDQSRQLLGCTEIGVRIDVRQQSPLHSGLGAGTQLTLAVARGLEVLLQRQVTADVAELSRLLGRGGRSAVGTAGFAGGGFIVDHGMRPDGIPERHLLRLPIPETWRFVLVRPRNSVGLSGDCELAFFDQRRTMTPAIISAMSGQIQDQLIPALRLPDFAEFAHAVEEYGQAIGRFYASEQGDVFSHPGISRLVNRLHAAGVRGAAQSSWGPGICIPASSTVEALRIHDLIANGADADDLDLLITEPLNHGATIRSTAPEPAPRVWL